ncbi:restriction endonuclease subunit S [Brachyspira innocens]|uniref:restriction endonuclease subunit S n=1 Tax=Brachyspira innocens TaxID=13264 RepID=UPI0026ECBC2A|nr:restriction endonuclease subunit S [Brachyspira innocens]
MKNNDDNSNVEKGNIYKPIYYGNWEEKILYDLAIWKNGLAFKNINFTDSGKPVIKIAELKNGITAQTKFTQDVFDDSVYLKKGDMLFSWSGNPETSIDVFYYNLPDGWLNQHIFKIQTKDSVFYRYFFYILKYLKPNFIAIATNKQTTGLGHVTINDLKKLKIKLPPLEEQKKIASVLSSLDDKIELNNRMNKILEEMAQTIFKEWFVNFNFPNEDGKPYKDSGGKMIESELGAIPDGWEITNLDYIVKVIKGKKPKEISSKKTDLLSSQYLTIDCYNNSNIEYTEYIEKMYVNKLDIIMVMDGASSGKLFYGKNGILSSTMAKFHVEDIYIKEIVFFFLKKIENEIMYHTTGSAIPHANKHFILNKKIVLPPKKLFNLINKLKMIREKIILNTEENQKLDSIRDTLLPKLMSGEIKIK